MEVRDIFGRRKSVSLPFSDFCQPLFHDKDDFKKVFEFAIEIAHVNKWDLIIIRGDAPFEQTVPLADTYYRHILPLCKDDQAIFKTFRNTTQRNIKKAIKSNVSVTFDSTYRSMQEFYRLNCLARRSHGLPSQPHFFFDNFYRSIIEKGHGEVALARHNGKVVSASVYLHFGAKVSFKYGASDPRMTDTNANYLIMWEAIRRSNAAHYDTFCFGRTEADHKGLLQFKLGWGTEQITIKNYAYSVKNGTFVASKLKTSGIYNTVFRRMPLPMLKTLSFFLYKYMG